MKGEAASTSFNKCHHTVQSFWEHSAQLALAGLNIVRSGVQGGLNGLHGSSAMPSRHTGAPQEREDTANKPPDIRHPESTQGDLAMAGYS